MAKKTRSDGPIIIKKYANRRLYDTSSSSYVTLDHLAKLIREGVEFEVVDAKTHEDLTRSVLTQIIFEQEQSGAGALPTNFLRQLIKYYDTNVTSLLPAWLDMSMNSFAERQEKWRGSMGKTFPSAPFGAFEEQAKRNMEMFEQAMSMFMPGKSASKPTPKPKPEPEQKDELADLQEQLAAMQEQLRRMSDAKSD